MHPPPIKPLASHPWAGLFLPLFLALLLLLGGGRAPAAEPLVHGQGLLWQIERDGVRPSYLFGTIHVTDPEVLALPSEVSRAFDQSDSLTSEVILSPETMVRTQRFMLLPEGRSLEGIVGEKLFQDAAALAAGYGIPPEILQRLKPWAAMTFFILPDAEMQRKLAGEKVLDERFQEEARRRGMATHALEQVEEQLSWFDNLDESVQASMLASVIDFRDQMLAMYEDLRLAYLEQDNERILTLMQSQQVGTDPVLQETFMEQMLLGRNDRMAERMVPRLDEGASFIAVGALHLPGERGILRQLENRGYRITRLY
jgi:uncharacterized protein YbaP (TraB family)